MGEPEITIPRMPFMSLNLGHVLTIISMLAGGAGAYYGMKSELTILNIGVSSVGERVSKIESALTQLSAIAVITARQDEQLSAIRLRLDRIESKQK